MLQFNGDLSFFNDFDCNFDFLDSDSETNASYINIKSPEIDFDSYFLEIPKETTINSDDNNNIDNIRIKPNEELNIDHAIIENIITLDQLTRNHIFINIDNN